MGPIDETQNAVTYHVSQVALLYSFTMRLPPVIRIEPASSCNLRCVHCPTGLGYSPQGIMSEEVFGKLIADLRSSDLSAVRTFVLYHGGEPLLNRNLPTYISLLRQLGNQNIKVVTNGKLLTAQVANDLFSSGLSIMEVSLDATSPEDSDLIRTPIKYLKSLMKFATM
jgi:molybdenum cofactor biosynthesis enzyme MoaA